MGEAEASTRILVLDQDRLFNESLFGKRVAAEIDLRSRQIATENRQLEAKLEEEERDLTAQRPSLEAADFRARADAFNEKVQRIRAEQDAKARSLAAFRDAEQQRFIQALRPVLSALAEEHDAVAILDRRLLLLARESIDITLLAIERVDEMIGDGSLAFAPEEDAGGIPATDLAPVLGEENRLSPAEPFAPAGDAPPETDVAPAPDAADDAAPGK